VDKTIVEPDPTAEYLLSIMPADDRELLTERWNKRIRPNAPVAQSVDRMHYGFDSFRR